MSELRTEKKDEAMNIIERRRVILDTLQQDGSADITGLAKKLGVSSMTIRRDLKELAGSGSITITQGTAVLNDGALREYNMLVKHDIAVEEKRRIARYCLKYVTDGSSLFLDAGTTTRELATLIARNGKSVNIMTHSLLAANELTGLKGSSMIMCPGEYRDMSMAFMGPLTDDFVRKFQIDVLFLSTEGIDCCGGVSVVDVADGHAKKVLIEQAKLVVLMVDSSKFEKAFFYQVASLGDIDVVVTDTNLSDSLYEEYRSACREIVRA